MPPINFHDADFRQLPVIGILRGYPVDAIQFIVEEYLQAGFHTLEITWNSPNAGATIEFLAKTYGNQLNLGVGTILTQKDLQLALEAGARFVVTPIVNQEVIEDCTKQQIPIFPGAYTPTEVITAWNLGATAVKLFPAEIGGLAYVKALKAPLSEIPLIPTGGISLENVVDFLDAGVFGLGMGSQLFPKEVIAATNWTALKNHLNRLHDKIIGWNNNGKA